MILYGTIADGDLYFNHP